LTKSFANPVATKGDNNVDNVEKIEVTNTQLGNYEIVVSHKGSLVGGSQNYSLIVSGIDVSASSDSNELSNQIDVYPNPVLDQLNAIIPSHLEVSSISVFDLQGRKVNFNQNNAQSQGMIALDLSHLTAGIYMVSFELEGNKVIHRKIVKK
jgi:hypothetical protein